MIEIGVRFVRPEQVEPLKAWFERLETDRRDEAIATLIDETVTHETAMLVETADGPLLVYAMEVEDPERAKASADSGRHPIDAEHRTVMRAAAASVPLHETILDLRR